MHRIVGWTKIPRWLPIIIQGEIKCAAFSEHALYPNQATVPLYSETHAGEDVALYAQGPGAQKARGVIEQNVIYDIIRSAFGWE